MKKKSITYTDLSKKQLQHLKELYIQKKVECMSHKELKEFVLEIISHQINETIGKEWLTLLDEMKLLTIGPQTSKTCVNIFGRVDREAAYYTFEGLLEAAIDIFN